MVLVKCDNCGKEFECQNFRIRQRVNIFCCKKCEGEYRKAKPNHICPICGKPFHLSESENRFVNCCSYKCMGEYRKIFYVGENNPNYGNKGSKNPIWKSDKRISPYGYILVRDESHPYRNVDGFVFEHRLIAERYLLTEENRVEINGKFYLKKGFDVHHKDRNRQNNSPENLLVLTRSEHMKLHHKEKK